jgi:hypothetical protein
MWFATGIGIGLVVSRRVAQSPTGSATDALAARLATRVRRAVDDVIADGRIEMHRREARLRAVLAAPERNPTGVSEGRR